jgi:hypothetical protein
MPIQPKATRMVRMTGSPLNCSGHHAGEDDHHEEEGHVGEDLDEALDPEVEPAAEVSHHHADGDADHVNDGQIDQGGLEVHLQAAVEVGEHVVSLGGGAEPVAFLRNGRRGVVFDGAQIAGGKLRNSSLCPRH